MTEQKDGEKRSAGKWKIAVRVMALALLAIAALYLFLNVILNTPQVTGRISRFLSDSLHQPATVGGVYFTGGTIIIHGLTIGNPSGFTGGNLITAGSIKVTPVWGEILAGRKSFSSIRIEGLKIALNKNSAGEWNFSGLTRLTSGKKSAAETLIKRLVLERAAVAVNGRGITDISLSVNDLSTKGSTGSGVLLNFRDDYGALYRLQGSGRLGPDPSLNLSISAPSLSFKALRSAKIPINPEKGTGNLLLTIGLKEGVLKLDGAAAFNRLTLLVKGEDMPLSGALDFAGRYDVKGDFATIDRCTLQINGAIRLHAGGRMDGVKKERTFKAEISQDGLELSNLFALIPRKLRSDFLTGGTLLPGTFRIAGNGAAGITSGNGGYSLRHGKLGRGERMFVKEIAADAILAGAKAGWELHGRVSQPESTAGIPVRLQDIPFTTKFSSRMRLIEAQLPSFKAAVAGIPIKGKVVYIASAPVSLNAMIEMREAPIAPLAGLFPVKNLEIAKGLLTASVRITGRGPGEIRGDVIAGLTTLRGTYNGKKISLDDGSTQATAGKSNGNTKVMGKLKINGGILDGKKIVGSFAYRVADGQVTLTGGDCAIDKTILRFAEINGVIPQRVITAGVSKLPLKLRFNGISCQREGSGVDGLSGNLNAFLISSAGERWLEGEGSITAPSLIYGGKGVGSILSRIILARRKDAVEINGKVMDGNLTASVRGEPFFGERKGSFTVTLSGMAGARFPELLGKKVPVTLSRGMLDAALTGDFSAQNGVRCHMKLTGADMALTGKNGRTFLTGGGLKLDSDWVDGSFLLREGVATIGKEMEVDLRGKLSRAAASDREGEFNLSLPKKVTLIALLDTFANILPRSLQEAVASGNMAAHARVRIKGKRVAVDGKMSLEEGGVEIPSQKLTIAGINGMIPFAVDFAEKSPPKLPERLSFSRENYSRLLTIPQQAAKSGDILTIGTVCFGTTEFGKTAIAIRGDNGWTEIVSLSSSLFEGALSGRGFFRYQGGAQYGADILIHDMSLRELCNSYPAIKGYLSGRVDGFVSLFGKEKGLNDMKGLVNIWTRSVKNEKMLVSKEFLQKLAGKKIKGLFFQNDRPYDRGEIGAYMDEGYLTFTTLDISHTNFLGIKDLSVSVAPVQNKISLDHLFTTIREAATRGKAATGGAAPEAQPASSDFKWEE